jgi:hypothetical protein
MDKGDELDRLGRLRADGRLSEDEFRAGKQSLVARDDAGEFAAGPAILDRRARLRPC